MKNKKGISLIVLVITIIVMVVLASAVIVTLNNANIIDRANEATESTSLKQVEQIANLAWSEAYLGNLKTDEEFEDMVLDSLDKNGVNIDDYIIEADKSGVTVTLKPKLNEYGFYYNQLYYNEAQGGGFIFYSDGSVSATQLIAEDETLRLSSRLAVAPSYLFSGKEVSAQYTKNSITLDGVTLTVSNKGKSLVAPDVGEFVCNFEKVHYTYKNSEYITKYNETEVKVIIDSKANLTLYMAGEEYINLTNENILDADRHMTAIIGSGAALFTSLDGENIIAMLGSDIICCKRVTTKTNSTISKEIYTGTWETKKEFANGKMSKAVVTNGTKEIPLGTLINYMPNGVGPTSYKGNWMLFGADEQGRLLIASVGILEELTIKGKNGYDTIVSILEEKAKNYKDGTIGISARTIKMQDLVDLLEFDVSTSSYYSPYYGDPITYSWSGSGSDVKYSYVKDGKTQSLSIYEDYPNGFTYKDETTNEWVTAPYVEGQTNEIVTMIHNIATMGSSYMAEGLKLKTFLTYNQGILVDSSRYVTRLVADNFQRGYAWGPYYGVYAFDNGLGYLNLVSSHGDEFTQYGTPCAIVTLSPNVKLRESSTIADGYDVSI